jgi:hypothetical protein
MFFVPSCRLVHRTLSLARDDSNCNSSRGEAHKKKSGLELCFYITLFVVIAARPNNVFTTIEESKAALVDAAEALD